MGVGVRFVPLVGGLGVGTESNYAVSRCVYPCWELKLEKYLFLANFVYFLEEKRVKMG